MVHVDTKRLLLLREQNTTQRRDDLLVAIDDYSCELYAAVMPDKSANSAATLLREQVIEACPYLIECVYSDNGTEYKGMQEHSFIKICTDNQINRKYTKPRRPQTNGKAERVIRPLMEIWHEFHDSAHREQN